MATENFFRYHERRLADKPQELEKIIDQFENDMRRQMQRMKAQLTIFKKSCEELSSHYPTVSARIAELEAEIEELKSQPQIEAEPEDPQLTKASTIAIFDSILFAIENWSTDGDTAPDFSLACQAILFPLVYDQVMNGNEHYYLKRVPDAALEVVKRGREYIKFIRSVCPVGLTDQQTWTNHIPMVSKWWINDALPLLYGARDPAWENNSILSLEDIMVWRDQPASRALKFPLVFDAMDLVDRYGESIRETTKLPDFTLTTLSTRLETN